MATKKKTIKELESEWDSRTQQKNKKTTKELEAEWDSGSTQRNAGFAAGDFITIKDNLPGLAKSYADKRYQLGGSTAIRGGGVIPEYGTYSKYAPIISQNLAAGKDYLGYSDEELAEYQRQMLALAEEARRGYNQATARTGGIDSIDMTGMPRAQKQELQALGNLSWRDDVYKSLSQPAAMGKQTPNIASAFESPELYAQWVAAGGADETMQQLLKERETGTDYLDMYTAYDEGQIKKDLLNMQSYYSPQNPYRVTDEQYQDSRRRVYAALGTDYDEASRISGGKDNQWVMDALNAYRTGKNAVIEGAFGGDESKIDAYKKNVEATEEWLNYVAQKGKKLDTWQKNAEKATSEQLNAAGSDIDYYRPQPMYLNIDPTYLGGYREYQYEDGTHMPADEYRKNAINEWLIAYVDAGDNEAKISALDETRGDYLPELEGYNLDALRYLDDEQKKALFTAHNNNDEEKVRELLDTYMYGLDFQRVSDMETAWKQKYTEADTAEKIGMNVQSVGQNVGTALEGVKQAIWSIAAPEALEGISEYSPAYDKTRKANITRQMTGGEIAAKTEGVNIPWTDRNLWEAVYHGVMSGADSTTIGAMFAPLGPVAQAVAMGGISFANERMNKLQEGYSNSDANMDAWISAAIEGASEYLPFDIWGKNSPRAFVKALSGTAAETFGEMASELGSAVYDEVKYEHGRNELMAQGYGFDGENLWGKWLETKKDDILAAGIGGLVSGGGMSTISAASDSVQNNKYGTNLSNNEGEQALADLAETLPVSKQAKDIVARMRSEMSERTKGDKAEGEIAETAAVTKEDADAAVKAAKMTARDNAEQADAEKGAKAEAEIADAATVTKRDANKAAKEQKHKAVKKAEIGYVYREVMRNLDEGAKNIVAQSFARDTIETELAQAGFRGDMRKAANDVVSFISGKTDSKAIERIKGNAAMREVALSYMAEIENAQGELYSKAGELAQRASKDYVKPESTKAEKGAQEATQGVDDRAAVTAENVEVSDVPESMVDGKAVTIEGVAGVAEDGSVTYSVKDADGNVSEVSETDVEIGQNDETIATLSALAKDLGKNAETMIRMYAGSQNVEEYATEFRQAMQYGEDGRNLDVVKGYAELNNLSPEQITAAYEVGRGRRTLRNQQAVRKNAAGITVGKVDKSGINEEILDDNQRAAVDFMSELAQVAGFNVRFVESSSNAQGKYADEAGEGFNQGEWNARTMTLTLDVHAGSNSLNDGQFAMMHTAGHELTHYIRQFADTDLWNDYQEFVIGHLSRKGFDFENEIEFHMEKEGLDRDGAIEEIIADASGEALNNITEADIQSLAETNPSLLSRIKAFFKQWISDLKARISEAYKGTEAKTEAGRQMVDAVDEMGKRWNALFINATRNRMRQNAKATEAVKAEPTRSLGYRHIDQRTFDSVKEIDTELFMSDAEEAQIGMGAAAKILLSDLENSIPGQKIWIADGEVSGQKRQTSELLGRMKDELGLTWDQLRKNLQQFAALDNVVDGEIVLPKNTPNNRRIELYLHEMLTEGYTALDGTRITPWDAYVEWVQDIDGAEGKKEYTAQEGDVDFVDYAWPGEVKYQARKGIEFAEDKYFGQLIDRIENAKDGSYIKVGKIQPESVLNKVGVPANDLYFDVSKIRKQLVDHNDHVDAEVLKSIPDILRNPVVIAEANVKNTVNVFGNMWVSESPVMVGIVVTRGRNGQNVINKVRTIHARRDYMNKITDESVLYLDSNKKRTLEWFQARGNVVPLGGTKFGFIRSIAQRDPDVKFSARRPEQTETEAFKRWFGDSKIVNADGSPKVMYHGTPYGGFRVFKDWQYFTDNPEYAKTYQEPSASSIRGRYDPATNPQTYAVYLNVKKPFDTRDPKIKKIWQEEFYNQYSRTPLSDKGLPDWTDGIDLVEFIEENEYDYDAIILDEGALGGYGDEVKSRGISVVVRDSTQIKSATDNIGTFETGNRDIYMQARNLSQMSDREILADAMMTIAKTPAEQDILERYRKRVGALNEKQKQLENINGKLTKLRSESRSDAPAQIRTERLVEQKRLVEQAQKIKAEIAKADAHLLQVEGAEVLRNMVKYVREETRRAATQQARQRAEERRKRDVQHAREVGQQRVKNLHAHREFEKYRKQMIEDVTKLHKWIVTPTSKGSAPQFLREPLAKFIDAFNYDSETKLRGKGETYNDERFKDILEDLRSAVAQLTDQQSSIDDGAETFMGYIDLPSNFRQNFEENIKSIRKALEIGGRNVGTPINRMTAEQMKELATAFRILNHSIRSMNTFISSGRGLSAKNAADETIDDMNEMKARTKTNKMLEALNSTFNWKNTTPYYAFQRLGRGGKLIFERLQDGWDRMARNSAQVIEYAKETFTDKESKEWSREVSEIKLDNDQVVKMTTAQKMSLYCLQKRQQAIGHLLGGGIRIADIEGKRGTKTSQSDNYVLTVEDINRITGSLTKRQREVADKLQEFMNTVCAEWGNEISMKRFGFRQMTELFYFPIETDANNRRSIDETKDGQTSMFRLLNMSSLKPLTPRANNAIVIHDIFDVFSDHASDMAKYNALALPILDFIKWYNHVEKSDVTGANGKPTGQITTRSVQKALERVYGKDAKSYLTAFIRDLNAEHDGGRNDGLINSIVGKAKSAAVGANLRVYALQTTSLPRAAYAISPKYLMIGAAKLKSLNPASAIKGTEAQENVGILKWKSLGFYSTDISRSTRGMVKRNEGWLGKIRDWQMAPAGWGDNWVSNIIYEAVKAEMADKHPTVQAGSATYNDMVNRRVREIVYKTQVVDSTMTRSDLMRSKGLASMVTAFMSEPTLTVNMLNESIQKAIELGRKGGNTREILRATGGLATRAATTWMFTSIATTLVESVMDAIRDDDEYETFLEKFWDAVFGDKWYNGNIVQNLNPVTMLPIINDIWSIVVEGYEDNSLIMQVATQFKSLMDAITSYRKGNTTLYNVIYKGTQTVSSMYGVGAANAARDGVSLYNTFLAPAWNTPKAQTYEDSASTAASAYYEAKKTGKNDEAEYYMQRMEVDKMDMEKVKNKIITLVGDDFVAGNITETDARKWLKNEVKYDEEKTEDKLHDWKFKKETGFAYSKLKENVIEGITPDYEAVNLLMKHDGLSKSEAQVKVNEWLYEKNTKSSYSDLKKEYVSGKMTEAQLRNHLKTVEGLDEEEIEERVSNYDYTKYTGRNTTAPKYWRIVYTYETGGDYMAYADGIFDEIMATGKSWKQARSSIASSLASYYKKDYLAVKGTAEGDRMLEEILDVYEAIGYSRSYERNYIAEKWIEEEED